MAAKPTKKGAKSPQPYLAAAVICEKTLLEPDNVPSAIRIVDTTSIAIDSPPPGALLTLPLTLLLIFKSGAFRGEKTLTVVATSPSGTRAKSQPIDVAFSAPDQGGATLRAPLTLKWDKEGVYWFEIFLGNRLYTRVPINVQLVKPEPPLPEVKPTATQ